MDDTFSTGRALTGRTPLYVRRLLVERVYIYAKLYNPGGSVILRSSALVDHDRPLGYSTEIGNSFHLDLIDLAVEFQRLVDEGRLSKKEVQAMLTWADGMSSREAADYLHARGPVSVQKLRERGARKLTSRMNDEGERKDSGRASDGVASTRREGT